MKVFQIVSRENNKNLNSYIIHLNIVIELKEILQMKVSQVLDLKPFILVIKHLLKIQNMRDN